eukprot:UN34375
MVGSICTVPIIPPHIERSVWINRFNSGVIGTPTLVNTRNSSSNLKFRCFSLNLSF